MGCINDARDESSFPNIKLIYFANKQEVPKEHIEQIFTTENELMEHIKYLYKNSE